MTESEWLSCTDPAPMLEFLRDSGRAIDRKLRLLACAIVRSVPFHRDGRKMWDLVPDYSWFEGMTRFHLSGALLHGVLRRQADHR